MHGFAIVLKSHLCFDPYVVYLFDCSKYFMTRCRRSFSSICFGRRIMSSSAGRGGTIATTSCCTSPVHLSSFSHHICLRGVAHAAQRLQTCFRLHLWVQTSLEFLIVQEPWFSRTPLSTKVDSYICFNNP